MARDGARWREMAADGGRWRTCIARLSTATFGRRTRALARCAARASHLHHPRGAWSCQCRRALHERERSRHAATARHWLGFRLAAPRLTATAPAARPTAPAIHPQRPRPSGGAAALARHRPPPPTPPSTGGFVAAAPPPAPTQGTPQPRRSRYQRRRRRRRRPRPAAAVTRRPPRRRSRAWRGGAELRVERPGLVCARLRSPPS